MITMPTLDFWILLALCFAAGALAAVSVSRRVGMIAGIFSWGSAARSAPARRGKAAEWLDAESDREFLRDLHARTNQPE